MGEDKSTGQWIELWEICEHCGGTGREPQTRIGMGEVCTAQCASGKKRKLITLAELRERIHRIPKDY